MAKQGQQAAAPRISTDVLKLHAGATRQRRAARLGGGVSAIALAAMLGASPALATPFSAAVTISPVPANGSAAGFVTAGSAQQNTSAAISSIITGATGSSTTNGNSANPLPSTQTVTGNDLSAYATGNVQTNSVAMAAIGSSNVANGIAVLAEQANTNTTAGSVLTTINAAVNTSTLSDITTNAAEGDVLALSNNLVNAEVTGNIADSSVTGTVPTDYTGVSVTGTTNLSGTETSNAAGNVVVGNSQKNNGLQAGIGSYANVYEDTLALTVNTSGDAFSENAIGISTDQSGNTVSALFNGNSTNNDIGVSLTSGNTTGANTLNGALTVANVQSNHRGNTTTPIYGIGAYNGSTDIFTDIGTGDVGSPNLYLQNSSVTQDNNTVSATVTGNSAVGSGGTLSPGNEITLGVNLQGSTTSETQGNTVNSDYHTGGGTIAGGADLTLGNLQDNNNMQFFATTQDGYIGSYAQNAEGSTMAISGNQFSAKDTGSVADNAINTANGAGINLISGLVALSNAQSSYNLAAETAKVLHDRIEGYLGVSNGPDAGYYTVLASTLTMANDAINVAAGANQVTNAVALSASTINAGALGESTGPAVLSDSAARSSTDVAGVSLNTGQQSTSPIFAYGYNNHIFASISAYNISGDSSSVTNASITANATQNGANNSIALTGSQSVTGTAGLVNNQAFSGNNTSNLTDNAVNMDFYTDGEEINQITNSSELLSGTQISSQATGNNASNSLSATGGQITNPVGTVGLTNLVPSLTTTAAQAAADLALSNVQQSNGLTSAQADGVDVSVNAASAGSGTISNSTFTVSGPANAPSIQSLSIGNEGINNVTASAGSLLSDSIGLVSVQNNAGGAAAGVSGAEIDARINSYDAGGAITNTSITDGSGAVGGSNGNIIRALAYGNQVANSFSASSGADISLNSTLGLEGVLGSAIFAFPPFNTEMTGEASTGVGAQFALLNDQVLQSSVTGTITSGNISIYTGNTDANGPVSDSSIVNEGNLIVASAFGNQADNSGSVSAGNISPPETYYPIANVTNLQSTAGDQLVGAAINNAEDDTFTVATYTTGAVSGSTLRLSNDTALTQVEGNAANNSLGVTANNITDGAGAQIFTGVEGPGAFTSAALSVQNVQYGGANISPVQVNTNAQINVLGNADSSSLIADGNQFSSTGYSNIATNAVAIGSTDSPVNTLDASASTNNFQGANGEVNVVLGAAYTPAVPGTPNTDITAVPYTVATGNNSGVISNGGLTLTVSGQPMVFDLSGLTADQKTAFEAAVPGGSLSGNSYTLTAGAYTLTNSGVFNSGTVYFTTGSAVSNQFSNAFTVDGTPGTDAIPASPSVLINVGGDITNSTVTADNNNFATMAVANSATNSTTIAATNVDGGGHITAGTAGGGAGEGVVANADYAVANTQFANAPVIASTYGEAGINPTNVSNISGSSLSVSGNTQSAKAEANFASNTLSLTATNAVGGEGIAPPTAALVSDQLSNNNVTADSGTVGDTTVPGQVITAPGAMTDSSLTLNDNSNSALALGNSAINLETIAATTLDTASVEAQNATASVTELPTVTADYSLVNAQAAEGSVITATAVSQIGNADSLNTTTPGLNGSSVLINGNSTTADAYANEASNTLNMTAANSSATGAVLNAQNSSDAVTATGVAQVSFALNGGADLETPPAAATGSTITVSNNALQVQAVGNQATNALNATTGTYTGPQIGASTSNTTASATYAVLNSQDNSGPIAASSTGSNYAVALNSGGSALPVAGTTVTVSYNTVGVTAFGNSANNSMTLSALNSGNASAALQNTQTNEGNVTSNITNANFGTSIGTPGVSGVTSFVGNNSIVAGAVGNSAVNNIAVAH